MAWERVTFLLIASSVVLISLNLSKAKLPPPLQVIATHGSGLGDESRMWLLENCTQIERRVSSGESSWLMR
jgi:hypothetical protein